MKTKLITITLPFKKLYLTSYHHDLIVTGQTYQASFIIDTIEQKYSASLNPDSVTINLIGLNDNDFKNAILEMYDYDLLAQQILLPACFYGRITNTYYYDMMITVSVTSTKQSLNNIITRTYAKNCSAQWGDSRCKINKDLYKQQIQISTINNNIVSYDILNGVINSFYAPYLSDTLGNIIPILNLDSANRQFQTETSYVFETGQIYNLYAGCQRDIQNCVAYQNTLNYLGFLS